MALEAKLVEQFDQSAIRALEGREYVKTEFRPVPVEREDEARANQLLIVREAEAPPAAKGIAHQSDQSGPVPAPSASGEGEDGPRSRHPVAQMLEDAGVARAERFAGLLIGVGLDDQSKLRGSELSDLTAIKGIGEATAQKIKAAADAELKE